MLGQIGAPADKGAECNFQVSSTSVAQDLLDASPVVASVAFDVAPIDANIDGGKDGLERRAAFCRNKRTYESTFSYIRS